MPVAARSPSAAVAPDHLTTLSALARKVLWLATWTIHHANHERENRDGLKVGGHQASCASAATLMAALYFHALRPQDRVAVKPHAAPVFHAIQYLLGRQSREALENFRAFGGAQSYPSRTKDETPVDFSTGSVGLGVGATLFAALVQDYVRLMAWSARPCAGPDDRAHGRCRARRRQRVRGAARRLEARRAQSLVDHRLQPPEPRRRRQRPPVPEDSGFLRAPSAGRW